MPVRISEKKLFLAFLLFAISLSILITVKLLVAPVSVSEKGLLMAVTAIALVVFGVKLIKNAIHKA